MDHIQKQHENEPTPLEPGSAIPDQPGYVVGACGHRVAKSEWRAGFRNCERCARQKSEQAEPLSPERLAEIQKRVEDGPGFYYEFFGGQASQEERDRAALFAEVMRLHAEVAVLQTPPDFHNADHEARLLGLFADIAREFAGQPDVIASQVLLHSQSAIWAMEREYMRLYQLARTVLQSGPEGVAQYAKDNGCNGMVVAQSGSLDPEIEKLRAAGWVLEDRVEYVGGKRIRFMRPPTPSEQAASEPEIEPEPDPAAPRQIAVDLMLDRAHDLDPSDVWAKVIEHYEHLGDDDQAALVKEIVELAPTADITIGWRKDASQ